MIEICYTADANYLPLAATSAFSIIENTEEEIRFHILTGKCREREKKKVCKFLTSQRSGITCRFTDVSKRLTAVKGLQLGWFNPKTTIVYARIFIPEVLPDVEKCIYLDSDIIVECDIKELWETSLAGGCCLHHNDGYALAASADDSQDKTGTDSNSRLNLSPKHKYFNNGLLIINCKMWREEHLAAKLLELARTNGEDFHCPTQDLFNVFFENNYFCFPTEYNSMPVVHKNEIDYSAKIYHFVMEQPWFFPNAPQQEIFWRYARKTPFCEQIRNLKHKKEQLRTYNQNFQKTIPLFERICNKIKRTAKNLVKKVLGLQPDKKQSWDQILAEGSIKLLQQNGYKAFRLNGKAVVASDNLRISGKADNTFWTAAGVLVKEEYNFSGLGEKYVVIDIGSNIGITSLYLAAKPEITHVYGFEPFIETYRQGLNNLEKNPALQSKITMFHCGLSDRNETKTIHYNTSLPGSMSTVKDRFPESGMAEEITLRRASETLQPIFDQHPESIMLKMDCEGGENEILPDLLSGGLLRRIKIIIMEWHFEKPDKWVKMLNENGFITFCTTENINSQGMIKAINCKATTI